MELKDIKEGMRVVPLTKSTGIQMGVWSKGYNYPSYSYFKENGYLKVMDMYDKIECGDGKDACVNFLPQDLIPYIEKKEDRYLNKVYDIFYLIGGTFKVWQQSDMKQKVFKLTGTLVGCSNPFVGQIQVIDESGGLNIIPFDSIVSMVVKVEN